MLINLVYESRVASIEASKPYPNSGSMKTVEFAFTTNHKTARQKRILGCQKDDLLQFIAWLIKKLSNLKMRFTFEHLLQRSRSPDDRLTAQNRPICKQINKFGTLVQW